MSDISMCATDTCPSRSECYRFRAEPSPYWQSYLYGKPDERGRCDHFWPVEKEEPAHE